MNAARFNKNLKKLSKTTSHPNFDCIILPIIPNDIFWKTFIIHNFLTLLSQKMSLCPFDRVLTGHALCFQNQKTKIQSSSKQNFLTCLYFIFKFYFNSKLCY